MIGFFSATAIVLWAMQISGRKISQLTSLSKPTVTQALSELRSICFNKILNVEIKLGDLGKTVEMDESKFGTKIKYKRREYRKVRVACAEGVWGSRTRIAGRAGLLCSLQN